MTTITLGAQPNAVVRFTQLTDGHVLDLANSQFHIEGGRIGGLTEYWPETHAALSWRSEWLIPLHDQDNSLKIDVGGLT